MPSPIPLPITLLLGAAYLIVFLLGYGFRGARRPEG